MTSVPLSGQSTAPSNRWFEATAWRYMRLSGVLLVPLAFIHLLIMHILNSVYVIDYQWVIEKRWAFLGWRIYDAFLLWFAGFHGFNGLRYVINDYVSNKGLKTTFMVLLVLFMIFVLIVGSIALIGSPLRPVQLEGEALLHLFRL